MDTIATQIDVRACASAVITTLDDLQGYLRTAVNPDRIALADLEMEPMGWTKRVYSQKAFDIWRKQLKLFPDDHLTLHHMAIMHHARAFDLEAGTKPSESDADWKAAMGFWHRLHAMDDFWNDLTTKACSGRASCSLDDIKKLREDFPQMILAIHYDIALDKETRDKRKSRAKFHIAMVQKAPFDAKHRTEAQRAAYNRYIQSVPDEVWQPNELREEVLAKGQKAIVEYLDFDPGCIPALEDALRLQRRIQRSRNTTWRALSQGDPQRKALLLLEKKDAEVWRPFFDQLATVADELEESVREDLSRWYHGRGVDLCALDLEEKAIGFYEQAVGLCRPDDDGRRTCQRDLVQTMAYVAREKAAKGDAGSKAYCDKVRVRDDITATACLLLAQAYLQLSLFDMAVGVCDKGLKIEPDFDDLEADERERQLTELKQQIPILRLIPKAKEAMEAGRFEDALRPLNESEKLAKAAGILQDHNSIYWLRAQANLALDRLAEAKRDVELYKGLLNTDSSAPDIQAAQRLEEMISQAEEKFREFGGPAACNLRQQAVSAFNEDRPQEAIRLLRQALKESERGGHRGGAPKLKSELLIVLMPTVTEAMEAGRFEDALCILNEAEELAKAGGSLQDHNRIYWLRAQAHLALDRTSEAKRDVELYKGFLNKKSSASEIQAAHKLEEMIGQIEKIFREFGCREAFNLRQQAITAFNEDRHQEAIRLLRAALEKSRNNDHRGGAPKLKEELSMVLTNAAIGMVNSAQEKYLEERKRRIR